MENEKTLRKPFAPVAGNTGLRVKIFGTVFAALIIGGVFFFVNSLAQRQTIARLTLMGMLGEMGKLEQEFRTEILHNSIFLYHNYDDLQNVMTLQKKKLAEIKKYHDEEFIGDHPTWDAIIDRCLNQFARQDETVFRFLTANSTIKNSSMYIPILIRKYIDGSKDVDPVYLDRITGVASTMYLAKNGLDQNLIEDLDESLQLLEHYRSDAPEIALIQQSFLAHLRVFTSYFPHYAEAVSSLLSSSSSDILMELHNHLALHDNEWNQRLKVISVIFLGAFVISIGMIVVLLVKTGRENQTLIELQTALTAAATTDRLTSLANRFAFDNALKSSRSPILYLINIDKFKNINNLYGVQAGDFVLCAVAEQLSGWLEKEGEGRLYRLGGDDFGLLFEKRPGFNMALIAQTILEIVENQCFQYRRQTITIDLAIGISDQPPLLETADMALNQVRIEKKRLKFLMYDESLNIQQNIAENYKVLNTIRHALEGDGVLPAYQPIVDNRTGAVAKYECLIRLRDEQGHILFPGDFLDIAKNSAFYPELTMAMIRKTFELFRENGRELSINLSVTDIEDHNVNELIISQLKENPDLAGRLTIEILESEGVENYESVLSFIQRIKTFGCRFAADDFGSGYSNFIHLLKLQMDILKIDASLIKNLDRDESAVVLVGNIVDFCRKLNIMTVAEYVHSQAILDKVIALGIDYSQGYHVGKPQFDLPESSKDDVL